ncbi:extracellular solute-binding protein [Dechloromonas sp. HYN0024]|uniref:extracellular solute-binding protein n=1 Tax=Dechloromonas sp. HYN0024 TaxID=2231055 RepID=UPI000E43A43E|nr:extracellular solute-binding protein [Dechloromonas sp. HYN0024]AXS80669.1 extracellular solute-binding protein [Dechloromonas sp. HYN0024]
MSHCVRPLALVLALALASSLAQAKPPKPAPAPVPTAEFELAHNLGAVGEDRLQAIVDRFNKESGSTLKLVRLEKGGKPAALNLVSRYDMSDVLSQPKQFVPLYEMMTKAGEPLKMGELSADLKAGSLDAKGRLVALPVLYSTPVLFYNKNAFRKAGLNPDQPPKTWFEMQGMLDKLQDAGYACPYTSSWPVWVHVDNVSAISGLPAVSDKGVLAFNGLPQVKHLAMMATWTKANYFKLFGRRNEASARFHEGECAMISTDSREHTDFRDAKGVELGVAPLPYHDDVYGGRQSSLADGASLWIGAGRSAAQYKQAAKFVSFLISPEMQLEIVRVYGGLPLTSAARAAMRSKLLQDGDKTLDVAYASLNGNGGKSAVRVANIDPVRIITNEELEAVWDDRKPAKAALDTSVHRGNVLLGAKPLLKKAQPF